MAPVDRLNEVSYKQLQDLCNSYNDAFERNKMNCRNKKSTLRGALKRARTWAENNEEKEKQETVPTKQTHVSAKVFQRFKGDLCGETAPNAQVPRVSKAYVKSFHVLKAIGRGVYGAVQKVKKGNQTYALKTFHTDQSPALRKDRRLLPTLSKSKQALENEMALLSNLHHPNIVRYCQAFYSEAGVGHILMDFIAGPTLLDAARSHTVRQRQANFVSYATQLFSALVYLHENGVAHLDVKPENIVIAYGGIENRPVLVDFSMSCTQKMIGTQGPDPKSACVNSFIPTMTIYPYYNLGLNFEAIVAALKHLEATGRLVDELEEYGNITAMDIDPNKFAKKLFITSRSENISATQQDFQSSDVFGMTRSLIDYALGQPLGTYPGWSDDKFFILWFLVSIWDLGIFEKAFEKERDRISTALEDVSIDTSILKGMESYTSKEMLDFMENP